MYRVCETGGRENIDNYDPFTPTDHCLLCPAFCPLLPDAMGFAEVSLTYGPFVIATASLFFVFAMVALLVLGIISSIMQLSRSVLGG